MSALCTIQGNTDGCAEQYICATALYLMSVLSQRHSIIFARVISAPVHVKEIVDSINAIYKRYMYQLMSNVQLPGSNVFDSHILMHSCTQKQDVSLAKEFQKHLSKDDRKHGFIDQGKYSKRYSKITWKDREYHVQYNYDVSHKDVRIYCDTNKFQTLPFCGSHPKTHGARGLGKHYHIRLDPNIGHGICSIRGIPCDYVACTSMLDQPWISGFQSTKQARYQPVVNCTYWPVLFPCNNCNIIHLIPNQHLLMSLMRYIRWFLTE